MQSALPLEEKQRQIGLILATMGEIRSSYSYAVLVGEPLAEELSRIQAFTLLVLDEAARLSAGSSIDRHSVSAWKTTLDGVVASLSDRQVYSKAQIARLAAALAAHYPAIGGTFSADERREFHDRIADLVTAETDPALRSIFVDLLRVAGGR